MIAVGATTNATSHSTSGAISTHPASPGLRRGGPAVAAASIASSSVTVRAMLGKWEVRMPNVE
jgi:hypothetical protein